MTAKRLGIQLASLLPGVGALPGSVRRLLELTIDEHQVTTSPRFFIHEGVLVSLEASLGLQIQGWATTVPVLSSGLRFRLALRRQLDGASPTSYVLDVFLDRFQIEIPGVVPARRVESTAQDARPVHLEPDPAHAVKPGEPTKPVHLVGGGILRIENTNGAVRVHLVDTPDPFDPDAPAGPIASIRCEPSHMLLGSSGFGLTLGRFTLDLSETTSPPAVLVRNQNEAWTGLHVNEAALYLPVDTPVVGPLSLTLRDALFGVPAGMQFDAALEWGSFGSTDLRHWCGLTLHQGGKLLQRNGNLVQLEPGPGPTFEVAVTLTKPKTGADESHVVGARVNDRVLRFPVGAETQVTTTIVVHDGDVLRMSALLGTKDEDWPSTGELIEVSLTFKAAVGTNVVGQQLALLCFQIQGGVAAVEATSIRGTAVDLAAVRVTLSGETGPVQWLLGKDFGVQAKTGDSLDLGALERPVGSHVLVGTGNTRIGHARIEVVAVGPLLVGTAAGVVQLGDRKAKKIHRPLATYGLPTFLREGRLIPSGVKATESPVAAPKDGLVEVELDPDDTSEPSTTTALPLPKTIQMVRKASVMFNFGNDEIQGWVWKDNVETLTRFEDVPGGLIDDQLRKFLIAEPKPKEIYVVGRTDDVWWNKDLQGNTAENKALGIKRAEVVRARFQQLTSVPIHVRSEQETFSSTPPTGVDMSTNRRILDHYGGWKSESTIPVWAKLLKEASTNHTLYVRDIPPDVTRMQYRRADIYVVGEAENEPPSSGTSQDLVMDGSSARLLLPGPLSETSPKPVLTPLAPPPKPRAECLVRLRGVWDSPVVRGPADAMPTLAEVTAKWKPANLALLAKVPAAGGTTQDKPVPIGIGTKAWQIAIRVAQDLRAGASQITLTVDFPDDALSFKDDPGMALTLALAPAIAARLPAAEGLVALPALLGAGYAIAALGYIKKGAAMVHRAVLDYTDRGGRSVRLACDYTVGLDQIEVPLFGDVKITGDGLRLRYSGVHVQVDWDKGAADGLHLGFDKASLSVAKAGTWKLTGPAGDLLRVTGSRSGVGSTWIELDLAFALDLGVVRMDGATIRLTFDDAGGMKPELRGLDLTVNVPKLLIGKGSMRVEQGGLMRGALDVKVIPAKLSASGALAIDTSLGFAFISLEVGVKFATAIPLASTGLGIFGFMGRFVANGTRALPSNVDDPVERELQWFQLPAKDKYKAQKSQYALGLGVVVGTLPDGGTTFNAEGSLSLGFPDISLVLGINAHFIAPPKSVVEEGEKVEDGKAKLVGLISVDESALMLGIRGSYSIPKIIDVQIPISGYFPFPSSAGRSPAYLRIGSDGYEGRFGQPVTVTLFPKLFDVKAWAYLMIEEGGIKRLGGKDYLNFGGFAIGFGAGFDLRWGAGPISLEASAWVLLGIGTKPLAIGGEIGVRGRLRLLFLSLGLDGRITIFLSEPHSWFEAEFCAEISLFFFSIRACISFSSGKSELPIPAPDPKPLLGVVLTDPRGAIVGTATDKPEEAPTVWPDTVPVVRFNVRVADNRTQGTFLTDAPQAEPGLDSPLWSGPEALRYCFRVDKVELIRIDASSELPIAGPLPSVWWQPSHRPGVVIDANTPTAVVEEAKELGLLFWHPNPVWRSILTHEDIAEPVGGGPLQRLLRPVAANKAEPADPLAVFIAQTFAALCLPSPDPKPAFARGQDAGFGPFGSVVIRSRAPSPGPFPSSFELRGARVLAGDAQTSTALLSALGAKVDPAAIRPLSASITLGGQTIDRALMIDHLHFHGVDVCTAAFSLQAAPVLDTPTLWLTRMSSSGGKSKVHPAELAGFPLGRLRIAHFGCAKLGPHRRVKRGGAVISALPEGHAFDVERSIFYGNVARLSPAIVRTEQTGMMAMVGRGQVAVHVRFPTAVRHVVVDLFVETEVETRVMFTTHPEQTPQEVMIPESGRYRLAVTGSDLVGLEIACGAGTWRLRAVEFRVPPYLPTDASIGPAFGLERHDASTALPVIEGRRHPFAPWERWSSEETTISGVQLLRVRPPAPGPWANIRILPWRGGRLAIVGVEGISNDARERQRDDQRQRDELKKGVDKAPKTPEAAAQQRFFLASGTLYAVAVSWSWRGHRRDAAPSGWTQETSRFHFRTAERLRVAPAIIEVEPQVGQLKPHFLAVPRFAGAGYNQGVFDPHGIRRYVLGVDPDPKGPPHFRHDPVSIHFAVDYLDALVGIYGYVLEREVRRTRAQAGELEPSRNPSPLAKALENVQRKPLPRRLMPAADSWIREAIDTSPCLPTKPALGGHTESYLLELDPGGEYELVLDARRKIGTETADLATVLRSRFVASRYTGPTQLMEALGFSESGQGGRVFDVVVSGAGPALPAAMTDDATALDTARAQLGLEPAAAAGLPRTTLLWSRSNNQWTLLGALFEADEPILRPGRVVEVRLSAKSSAGTTTSSLGWCDTTGSLILLCFNTGVAAPTHVGLTLFVETEQSPKSELTVEVLIPGGPAMALQEEF